MGGSWRERSSATSASSAAQMRDTVSLDSRSAPMRSRTFPTFLVETPSAYISATEQITARSTLLYLSTRPSGK